jgi:hypothetical protein
MEREIVAAPMNATPLIEMARKLDVPPTPTLDELREHLWLIDHPL